MDYSIVGISGPQIWGPRKKIPPPDPQNLGVQNTFPPPRSQILGGEDRLPPLNLGAPTPKFLAPTPKFGGQDPQNRSNLGGKADFGGQIGSPNRLGGEAIPPPQIPP